VQDTILSLHVIAAIFLIGPVTAAGPAIARATRAGDAGAVGSAARMLRIYGFGSLLVALLGFGLVQKKEGFAFSQAWIWISLILFLVALGAVLGVALPAAEQLLVAMREGTADKAKAAVGKVMGGTGLASIAYVVIAVLMVTKPGS
jgi:uncharacterized membrane protein